MERWTDEERIPLSGDSVVPRSSRDGTTSIMDRSIRGDKCSQNFEIVTARADLKKKIAEVKMLKKTSDIAQTQLKAMERNYNELKDSMDAKEKLAAKKQRIVAKLNITNQMLIQTLNTVELNTDIVDGFVSSQIASSKEDGNLLLSKNNDTYLQNLKLKESLLNLTRDHYRAADGIRHMGTGIEELRHSLQGLTMLLDQMGGCSLSCISRTYLISLQCIRI